MSSELHDILERGAFSPTTRKKYARIIDDWLAYAGKEPTGWTRKKAQAYYDHLIKQRGMKIESANVWFAGLRYVSKWFATLASRPELDFAVVQTRVDDTETEVRHALSPDDAIALLSTCIDGATPIDRRDRTILIVGFETGMRRSSLAGMTIGKLHEANGYPSIVVPIKGRGGNVTHDVPLSDTAMIALRDWLLWLAQQRVTKGSMFPRFHLEHRLVADRKRKTAERVSSWEIIKGPGISDAAIYDVIKKRGAEAGLHVYPHLLRHSFTTWRQQLGLDAPAIASITGHKGIGNWGSITPYLDMREIGRRAREATPLWLADFVRDRIR